MGNGSGKNTSDTPDQHPYVERIRPEPMKPPKEVVTLTGLLGRSDRDGHQRLYFTRDLGTFAEFLASDVLFVEPVPAAESPIQGIDASRVTLSRDATIHFTRSTKAAALDDFDLDVRTAGAPAAVGAQPVPQTFEAPCFGTVQLTLCRGQTCVEICDTRRTLCDQVTCDTCQTRCGQPTCRVTCQTCQTRCGQPTCENTQCGQNTCVTCVTCQTCPGQNTCQTCQTQCGTCLTECGTCQTQCNQRTCNTCRTQCDQATCDTCNPHVFTCGANPQCRF